MCFVRFIQYFIIKPPSPIPSLIQLTLGMAMALTFGIVILQADWTGDAAFFVDSDLNGFCEVAEARML